MQKVNYDKLMREQIKQLNNSKKTLLLHCCCAPCSSACLERLTDYFEITVLFYNPNIEDEEYFKRKAELIKLITRTGWASYLDCDHDTAIFYEAVSGLEGEKEGGKRCEVCFRQRLLKTFSVAIEQKMDFFTTTLTISPLKNAQLINQIGHEIGGDKWLYSDFKKGGGYLRSIELSKEFSLYRQNYCGCIFSKQ